MNSKAIFMDNKDADETKSDRSFSPSFCLLFPSHFFFFVFCSINSNAKLSPITFFAWDNGRFSIKVKKKTRQKTEWRILCMLRTTCHSIRHIKNMYYFHETNEHFDWHFYIYEFRNLNRKMFFCQKWSLKFMTTDSKLETWAISLMNEIVIRILFCIIFNSLKSFESFFWKTLKLQLLGQLVSFAFLKRKSYGFNH